MDKSAADQAAKDAAAGKPIPDLSKVSHQTRESYLGNYKPK